MGISERDYGREYGQGGYGGPPGLHLGGPRSMTANLLLLLVGIYVVQVITRNPAPDSGWFTNLFLLDADVWRRPWTAYQLVTYGLLHNPYGLGHIIFNGIALWIFGRWAEERYGSREFLALFLVSVVFAGVCWCFAENIAKGGAAQATMLGASGGISALLVVGVFNYPHRKLLLWFVLPVPVWLLGILLIGNDLFMAVNRSESGNVAYTAHLGGALFGFLYYQSGWRLSRFSPRGVSWPKFRLLRRPKLRVHDPDVPHEEDEDIQVDDILRKIRRSGQDSLTAREKRILERASKQYQQKRQ